jgi:hypothetical protein
MLLGKAASDMNYHRGGVSSLFEPLREETDQTGLELRKSFFVGLYEFRAQRVLLRIGLRSGSFRQSPNFGDQMT